MSDKLVALKHVCLQILVKFRLLISLIIDIIRIIVGKFFTVGWILFFIFVYGIYHNWSNIVQIVSKLGLNEYDLIKDYLQVILSLPVVILILGLLFLLRFQASISTFLENSRPSNVGPLGVEQSQSQTVGTVPSSPPVDPSLSSSTSISEPESERIQQLEKRAEVFEFLFLNQLLVANSKTALSWFYFQEGMAASKEEYLNNFSLVVAIANPLVEKETILSYLTSFLLVKFEHEKYIVTDKGIRFLKFIQVIV